MLEVYTWAMDHAVVLFDANQNQLSNLSEEARRKYQDEIREEGFRDAVKKHISDLASNKQRFENLVNNSGKVLYEARGVFPFDLFPDEIRVDPIKVNIIFHEFFSASRIQCIYIKNISDVFVDTGPFFASLKIIDQGFTDNIVKVSHLKRRDASQVRKIIQGLVVAHKQNVDMASIEDDHLVEKLKKLGRA